VVCCTDASAHQSPCIEPCALAQVLIAGDLTCKIALGPAGSSRLSSWAWAPPEQLLHRSLTSAVDVWSYGVICWELATAKVPLEGYSFAEIVAEIATAGKRLPVPPEAPRELLHVIALCWRIKPEERIEISAAADMLQQMAEAFSYCERARLPTQWSSRDGDSSCRSSAGGCSISGSSIRRSSDRSSINDASRSINRRSSGSAVGPDSCTPPTNLYRLRAAALSGLVHRAVRYGETSAIEQGDPSLERLASAQRGKDAVRALLDPSVQSA